MTAPTETTGGRPQLGADGHPTRPWTEPERYQRDDGTWATLRTVKRCCNGCGCQLGDTTEAEIVASINGELPDVRGECPYCGMAAIWAICRDRDLQANGWVCTFGGDHTHPETGESLAYAFVRVQAVDAIAARAFMNERFGRRWAFIYETEQAAGVAEFRMHEVTPPAPPIGGAS